MKNVKTIIAFLLLSLNVVGQQAFIPPQVCKIMCLSGEVKLSGLYREQEYTRSWLSDKETSTFISGSVLLNANTYFWHPNFLTLDVGLEYSPEQSSDNYNNNIIPDQGEIRTLKKLDLRTMLFQRKVVSMTAFYNISETYSNREFLSNVLSNATNWGGAFYLRSNFLPISINYQKGDVKQTEYSADTTRLYHYTYSNLEGRAMKSFGKYDKHEFIASRSEFTRVEREFLSVTNRLDELTLNDEIFFDKHQKYRFYSMLTSGDQTGYDTLQRFQAYETVSFKLPGHFTLIGNYNYYNIERRLQTLNQQTYRGVLKHKLFESLLSDIYYEKTFTNQTGFKLEDEKKGLDLAYEKKIPTGTFNLSYSLLLQNQQKTGSTKLHIYNEGYFLFTGHPVYFKLPNVEISSVIVKDSSGNQIYQEGLDYLLIPHGKYLEIARVPGGQIADGSIVGITYTATIPGSYQYDLTSQSWYAAVSFFKRLIGFSYRNVRQDYSNIHQTEEGLSLNYIRQQVYGVRCEYKAVIVGYEYDDNSKSSIMPYTLKRYYINVQGQLNQKALYILNGNYNDYHLVLENLDQTFADLSAEIAYSLTSRTRLNFDVGYRQQKGQGIDLDLFNARLEYNTILRQTSFTFGVQTFRRTYMEEVDNYNGIYFRISRRF